MYVLLHMWDHENGKGAKIVAINEDISRLQKLMYEEAQKPKSMIRIPGGLLWTPVLMENQDNSIRIEYNLGIPSVWCWEIQEVDSPISNSEG